MNSKQLVLLNGILSLIGLILIISSPFLGNNSFQIGSLSGFGGGLLGVSIVKLTTLLKNPAKARKIEIAQQDERSVLIRQKAALATYFLSLGVLICLWFTAIILNLSTALPLILLALFFHALGMVIFTIYYNKKI